MMSRWMLWTAIFLAVAVMASGIGVVYTKYLSRKTFAQLQAINSECVQAETRWMRLQLEESTLTSYLRVESQARNKLGLHIPLVEEIQILR
jgi:cell division protein FtsL